MQLPLERTTVMELLVARLESRINDRTYAPGDRLPPEALLAAELGVSRPILREGLAQLRERGYLRTVNGRGTFVRLPGSDELSKTLLREINEGAGAGCTVDDLYEARSAVETRAAALAAERHRQTDLEHLGRHLDDMIRLADDPLGFASADVRFHVAVTRAAQNPLLTALLQPLVRIIVEGMVDSAATDRQAVEDGIDHHREILDAVEAGDASRASNTMAQHLARSRQQFPATVLRFT